MDETRNMGEHHPPAAHWQAPTCDMCLERILGGGLVVEIHNDQAILLHRGACTVLYRIAMRVDPDVLNPNTTGTYDEDSLAHSEDDDQPRDGAGLAEGWPA